MPILKKGHIYKNKNPKNSPYIDSIMPQDDREVSKMLFDSFEDVTDKKNTDVSKNYVCSKHEVKTDELHAICKTI